MQTLVSNPSIRLSDLYLDLLQMLRIRRELTIALDTVE